MAAGLVYLVRCRDNTYAAAQVIGIFEDEQDSYNCADTYNELEGEDSEYVYFTEMWGVN